MPLYLTQVPPVLFCCRILVGSSGCMVYRLCEDTCIQLTQGSNCIIHQLRTQVYEIVSYHKIHVQRFNLICYLLLCSILRPDWDIEIISNYMNVMEHLVLKLKNIQEKLGFWPLVQVKKQIKDGRCLKWGSIIYGITPTNMYSLGPSGNRISTIKIW